MSTNKQTFRYSYLKAYLYMAEVAAILAVLFLFVRTLIHKQEDDTKVLIFVWCSAALCGIAYLTWTNISNLRRLLHGRRLPGRIGLTVSPERIEWYDMKSKRVQIACWNDKPSIVLAHPIEEVWFGSGRMKPHEIPTKVIYLSFMQGKQRVFHKINEHDFTDSMEDIYAALHEFEEQAKLHQTATPPPIPTAAATSQTSPTHSVQQQRRQTKSIPVTAELEYHYNTRKFLLYFIGLLLLLLPLSLLIFGAINNSNGQRDLSLALLFCTITAYLLYPIFKYGILAYNGFRQRGPALAINPTGIHLYSTDGIENEHVLWKKIVNISIKNNRITITHRMTGGATVIQQDEYIKQRFSIYTYLQTYWRAYH